MIYKKNKTNPFEIDLSLSLFLNFEEKTSMIVFIFERISLYESQNE